MMKVLVGLSGGVDSSVAASLLREQGHEVTGCFMKNWEDDNGSPYCSIKEDFLDAAHVAQKLNIDLIQLNFSQEYKKNVFSYFLEGLNQGRTPNPDIYCNKYIKFKEFISYAEINNFDAIATGHYCRTSDSLKTNDTYLLKGLDERKDQTYFLNQIEKDILKKCIFPIGNLKKSQVRALAKERNLITYDKKDSTGICFIGERPFPEFLSNYLPLNEGPIEDEKGLEIGTHKGLYFYTLGQRQGLGIGGLKDKEEKPWYVAKKIHEENKIIAVQETDHPLLLNNKISCKNINWLKRPEKNNLTAKIRYRQKDQTCAIEEKEGFYQIKFDEPQRAVTPGQFIVFYENNICLGGGEIDL